jgi:glycosyltransferase involved in cell wall biosynthesis
MRVAYLTTEATSKAGWGRYSVEVIKGMRGLGIDPVLITHSPNLDPALADIEQHVILPPVLAYRFSTPRSLLYTPRLRSILATCDLAHCLVELYAPLTALACYPQRPFVTVAHGTWAVRPLESRVSRWLFAPALRRAKSVICLSRFTQQWIERLITLPNSLVLTGGVTLSDYDRPVQASLPRWAESKKIALTSAGAFKQRKGQHVTLEAIAQARQQIPDLHWVLTGDPTQNPSYSQPLQQRIADLGLTEYVHFVGLVSQEELVVWYQRADVFVLNSLNDGSSFEGLGMVYLEAGAVGTPSIGSWNCGAEAAIIDGVSGFLVPQGDSEATAQALIRLLSDSALYQRMSAAARQQAHTLSWATLCQRLLTIYQAAIEP